MTSSQAHVARQIASQNAWYVSDQFEWAARPCIRRIYQRRFAFLAKQITQYLSGERPQAGLLDVGCGDGYWLAQLQQLRLPTLRLEGIDYNPLRLDRAERLLGPGVHLHLGDIEDYAFDAKYDIVLCHHVIEHTIDDTRLLRTIRRTVRDGGLLLLGTPNEGNYFMQRRNARLGLFDTTDHVHFYTEALIRSRIGKGGFTITGVHRDPAYFASDAVFYGLLSSDAGCTALCWLGSVLPSLCSGFSFACRPV